MRLIIISLLIILVVTVNVASAAEYKLLAPLPGGSASVSADTEGLSVYLSQLFWFLLSVAIILALVVLVIGAVEYVGAAGNTSLLGDAKSRIMNAFLGLFLALAAWLILNLINPDLLDLELSVRAVIF